MQFRLLSEKYFQAQKHIFSKQTPRKPSCSALTKATMLRKTQERDCTHCKLGAGFQLAPTTPALLP